MLHLSVVYKATGDKQTALWGPSTCRCLTSSASINSGSTGTAAAQQSDTPQPLNAHFLHLCTVRALQQCFQPQFKTISCSIRLAFSGSYTWTLFPLRQCCSEKKHSSYTICAKRRRMQLKVYHIYMLINSLKFTVTIRIQQ